ncbi:MAG TPA: hypothetical protein VNK52_14405 [Hyphomicrobiaceae bacterium]|nr:hypothetical protein [Hyphomicrobiaceae bacterium]
MRALFGLLAVVLGAISIALAARYGYKGADTEVDGAISGIVFGAIALCAFLFDAAAVRLWFMGHRIGAGLIGAIAAAALIVTFTNNLGAIAGRADATLAERGRAKADAAADRRELERVMREREAMRFTPATTEAVQAAREAVDAAERTRVAECGNGDPRQRGVNCRAREGDERAARETLARALADQAATERAARLDAEAARLRARLATAPPVQDANPLGSALEAVLGAEAAPLTAWQQAIVAAVFELCLVGVMVIYELLGQRREPPGATAAARTAERSLPPGDARPGSARPRKGKGTGSVKSFVRDHVFPSDDEEQRIEVKALLHAYRNWCAQRRLEPVGLDAFLDELEPLCAKLGIEIEVGKDRRVYALGVKIEAAQPASFH